MDAIAHHPNKLRKKEHDRVPFFTRDDLHRRSGFATVIPDFFARVQPIDLFRYQAHPVIDLVVLLTLLIRSYEPPIFLGCTNL
jgi:hypothetical protein